MYSGLGCSIAGVGDGPGDGLRAVGITLQEGGGGPQAWQAGSCGLKSLSCTSAKAYVDVWIYLIQF